LLGAQIAEVIRADLERSGLFKALDPASFIETQTNIDYKPTFADWRVIKSDALVSGRIKTESASRIIVDFRLWDVFAGQQLKGVRFATTPDNWRRTAHKASDAIYEAEVRKPTERNVSQLWIRTAKIRSTSWAGTTLC